MTQQNRVFVYGSLMSGHGNNRLLENAKYVANGITVDEYEFMSFGCYPAVRKSSSSTKNWCVAGELYLCDEETMYKLDRLESNGKLYQRYERQIRLVHGGVVTAWIYEYLKTPWPDVVFPQDVCEDFVTIDNVALWLGGV